MKRNRVVGWIVAFSKQEAIRALEVMMDNIKKCDDDVDMVNMYVVEKELNMKEAQAFFFPIK